MLESGRTAALTLCCYDPVFGPLQRDAPQGARVIGLPVFDVRSDADRSLPSGLERFLAGGPPPIVFTLGSFAIRSAGSFYAEATKAARLLNARAVLLTGANEHDAIDGSIFTVPYARHSLLFPRACAIVHHGGAGTTGQALLAGKPQLVVPHMGDQFDNAHRVERIGVGRSLPARRFTAQCAALLLDELLDNHELVAQASHIALVSGGPDPACGAANAIADLIWPSDRLCAL